MRLAEMTYTPSSRKAYVDPHLWIVADWSDRFTYPDGRRLAEVTRTYGDGTQAILSQGVGGLVQADADGVTTRVAHTITAGKKGRPTLTDSLRPPGG